MSFRIKIKELENTIVISAKINGAITLHKIFILIKYFKILVYGIVSLN
tara:strand:+ start:127 stop:270 length:144 start_codon:yes stop_codon:yes gene_type:complete